MSERLSPQKINFAKSTNYKLVINAIPGTTFWLTTANIPTISANEVPIPNPIHGHTYQPTTTTIYAPLMCTFLVDEDFSNYMELLNWINMTNHPDTSKRVDSKVDIRTTGSLHILSNNKNTSDTVFTFHNIFPTILGEIQFNNDQAEEVITDITLQFDYMTVDT